MNKFKLVLWVIILAIIALVIFQNQTFFFETQSLRINPGLAPEYQTPPIPIAAIFLVFFIFGMFLAYLFSVPERFRNRKAIKRLNAANATQKDEIDKLQKDVASLKGVTADADGQGSQLTAPDDKSDGLADDPNRPADAPEK